MSAGSTFLEMAVKRWKEVLEENERDKDLIDPEQLKSWEEFRDKTSERFRTIITKLPETKGTLPDSDEDWIKDLSRTIDKAKRVPRDELEAQKRAREEAEAARLAEEQRKADAETRRQAELASTRDRLLGELDF